MGGQAQVIHLRRDQREGGLQEPVKPGDFKQGDPEAKLAGPVAWPLRVGDCCANAGRKLLYHPCKRPESKGPVQETGLDRRHRRGIGGSHMAARPDFAKGLSVGYAAAAQAYKMAGITAKNVKVAEVHDCFTIAEIMAYEGLGIRPGR